MKKKTATKILCGLGIITNLLTASYGVNDLTLSQTAKDTFANLSIKPGSAIDTLGKLIAHYEENETLREEIDDKLENGIHTSLKIEMLRKAFATKQSGKYFKYEDSSAQLARDRICLATLDWATPNFLNDPLINGIEKPAYVAWFNDVALAVLENPNYYPTPIALQWCGVGGSWAGSVEKI